MTQKQLRNDASRWWTYQRERFPLKIHGPLIATFSLSAVGASALLRGETQLPGWEPVGVAAGAGLLFFLMLRIADEFKDREKDQRHRPHLPVPRGLVSLRELGIAGAAAAGVQLLLVLAFDPALLPLLLGGWAYFGLMTVEFFAPRWLNARPGLYLLSHMLIMPLIALFMTACDWRVSGAGPPAGLGWFLGASFFSGIVIEVGRKVRAPANEQPGVDTYTAAWGRKRAVSAWCAALLGAFACAGGVLVTIPASSLAWIELGGLATGGLAAAGLFLRHPTPKQAALLETTSGLWTFGLYFTTGILPLLG